MNNGKSTPTQVVQLVVITTDVNTSRVAGTLLKPLWFERRTNTRLHASEDSLSWKLHIVQELIEHGTCYAFTSSCKTALALPKTILDILKALNVHAEIIVCSPQVMPDHVRAHLAAHTRWGSVLHSELPSKVGAA